MADEHPTERHSLAELHGLGSWSMALAALDAVGPEWVLALRRGILAELRAVTFLMEAESYDPGLLVYFDKLARALHHLGTSPRLAIPVEESKPKPR